MNEPVPTVGVVVPIHGDYAQRYLAACCESLAAQAGLRCRVVVVIVHNGVTPAQSRVIEQMAPEAVHLRTLTNLGWTGANNFALRDARARGWEYALLLNADARLDRHCLRTLLQAAQQHPRIAVWQPTILLHATGAINSLGNRIHYLGFGYCADYGKADTGQPPATVDFVSGACMLVRCDMLRRVGRFRQEYFMYYDDVEFCWRARLAGYQLGIARQAVCYHDHRFRIDPQRMYYAERNRWLTLLTVMRWRTLLVLGPGLLAAQGVLSGYLLWRGWGGVLRDLWRFFSRRRTWRRLAARRRWIARIRTQDDADVMRRFAGVIACEAIPSRALRYVLNPLACCYWGLVRRLIAW